MKRAPTALIADDEPHLARALATELAVLWPELQLLPTARNGLEAAERLAHAQPDIAFLDIRMPGLTGLEVAQGMEGRTRVVFVTAYDEFAVQAFESEAVDYVLKPVTRERLQRTVQRVQRALADKVPSPARIGESDLEAALPDDGPGLLAVLQKLLPQARSEGHPVAPEPLRWIRAASGDLVHQIAVEDVLFFHADDKYTCVQTATAEHLIRTPIAELVEALDRRHFVQMHRSTIVNLRHLAGARRDETSRLYLRVRGCPRELPVSRAYVHLFKAM